MLNIIIFEDNKIYMQKNIDCINKTLTPMNIDYRIRKFQTYNEELNSIIQDSEMRKIYILDVEVNSKSGLEVASKIRETDWNSIIIFATAFEKYKNDVFYIRLMVLDFICKYKGYEERLIDDIKTAISIIDKNRVFKFSYNHVIYRIPYDQICYIEKEPIIKRCVIHTFTNDFYITGTLSNIMTKLEGNFIRTHQSCIINLDNAIKIDFSNNTIIFNDKVKTDMITNKIKKEIKEYARINK